MMIRRWIVILWTARKRIGLTWALLRDKRVPLWQKAIPFLPLLYILSPLNLPTFAIPLIGQVEDVMLVMLALGLFERTVDSHIRQEHQHSERQKHT